MKKHLLFYTTGVDPNEKELRFKVFEEGSDPKLPANADNLIAVDFDMSEDQGTDRDMVIFAAFMAGIRFSESRHPIFSDVQLMSGSGIGSTKYSPGSLKIESASQQIPIS